MCQSGANNANLFCLLLQQGAIFQNNLLQATAKSFVMVIHALHKANGRRCNYNTTSTSLLSEDWIELLWNVSLFGVLPLLSNCNHKIWISLAIGVCWCQVGCLKYNIQDYTFPSATYVRLSQKKQGGIPWHLNDYQIAET